MTEETEGRSVVAHCFIY